ncbi:hypothetical protein PybrP1_012897 [[Pythium] brassicae (nom. inval.)]|nr:hypothetical protein PybrP1_012897 [[Pythium] brassicae (nom. inval.)]
MPAASTSVAASKPRIPWDGDSAFVGGKTSIAILLEWLSAPGNGERWRYGGVRVGGPAGGALEPHFSKIELAREVVSVMEAQGITHRMARDVRWKINALCRSYATAARFLEQFEQQKRALLRDAVDVAQTRRTIESSEARVLTHVHTLCPYFDVLDPILKSDTAPSPRGTERRKKAAVRRSDDDDEEDDDNEDEEDVEDDDSSALAAAAGSTSGSTRTAVTTDHGLLNGLLELDSAARSEPPRGGPSRKRRRERTDDTDDDNDDEDERQIDRARRRARDAADAHFSKRKRELLLQNLELDNQVKKVQLERERLLLAKEFMLVRSQLGAAGVSQQEIDESLPPRPSKGADVTR